MTNPIYKEDGKVYKIEKAEIKVNAKSIFDWLNDVTAFFGLKFRFNTSNNSDLEEENKAKEKAEHKASRKLLNIKLESSLKLLPNMFTKKEIKLKNKLNKTAKHTAKKKADNKQTKKLYTKKFFKLIPLFTLRRAKAKNLFKLGTKKSNKFIDFTNNFLDFLKGKKSNKPKLNLSNFFANPENNESRLFKLNKSKMLYVFSNEIFNKNKRFVNKRFFQNKIFNVINNYRLFLDRIKFYFKDFYQRLALIKQANEEASINKSNNFDLSEVAKIDSSIAAITDARALEEINNILDELIFGYFRLFQINNDIKFKSLAKKLEKYKKEINKNKSCTLKALEYILSTANITNDLENSFKMLNEKMDFDMNLSVR